MLTCGDSKVLDDSGVIPQAESSTTTLDVGMAWTDLSEAQVRTRERISEVRCILKAYGGSKAAERGRDGWEAAMAYPSCINPAEDNKKHFDRD